jgi:hypothetical protein
LWVGACGPGSSTSAGRYDRFQISLSSLFINIIYIYIYISKCLRSFDATLKLQVAINNDPPRAMLLMRAQFHDVGPSDGGFVVIPGSHRSHFPLPSNRLLSMVLWKRLLLPPLKCSKRSLCQDRLGTNIGKAETEGRFCRTCHAWSSPRWAQAMSCCSWAGALRMVGRPGEARASDGR